MPEFTFIRQPDLEMGPLSAPAEQAAAATPENSALTTMAHNCPPQTPSVGESQSTDNQTSTRTSPPSQPTRDPETVRPAEPPSDATISDPTQSYRVGRLPNGRNFEIYEPTKSKLSFPARVLDLPRGTIL